MAASETAVQSTYPVIQALSPEDQYFLLAIPLDKEVREEAPATRLRFHSASHPVIVLTSDAPKLIRFHTETGCISDDPGPGTAPAGKNGTGCIVATSWNDRHKGKWWGMVLHHADDGDGSGKVPARGWEEVRMLEGKATKGFVWQDMDGDHHGREELVVVSGESEKEGEESKSRWTGWMVCDWSMGHKQLFWMTSELKGELPGFCERVRIVREKIWGQPRTRERPEGVVD